MLLEKKGFKCSEIWMEFGLRLVKTFLPKESLSRDLSLF